jgi:hypothetical protein
MMNGLYERVESVFLEELETRRVTQIRDFGFFHNELIDAYTITMP